MSSGEGPLIAAGPRLTDAYFLRTKAIVEKFGDKRVTYAVFMRRPVVFAPRLALEFLTRAASERGTEFEIEQRHKEGDRDASDQAQGASSAVEGGESPSR